MRCSTSGAQAPAQIFGEGTVSGAAASRTASPRDPFRRESITQQTIASATLGLHALLAGVSPPPCPLPPAPRGAVRPRQSAASQAGVVAAANGD
jgi:hypothetical protein